MYIMKHKHFLYIRFEESDTITTVLQLLRLQRVFFTTSSYFLSFTYTLRKKNICIHLAEVQRLAVKLCKKC